MEIYNCKSRENCWWCVVQFMKKLHYAHPNLRDIFNSGVSGGISLWHPCGSTPPSPGTGGAEYPWNIHKHNTMLVNIDQQLVLIFTFSTQVGHCRMHGFYWSSVHNRLLMSMGTCANRSRTVVVVSLSSSTSITPSSNRYLQLCLQDFYHATQSV